MLEDINGGYMAYGSASQEPLPDFQHPVGIEEYCKYAKSPTLETSNGGNKSNGSQPFGRPMPDYQHPVGIEEYRKYAKEMVDWICDYYAGVEQMPVRSEVEPGYLRPLLPSQAPQAPEGFAAIMRDVQDKIMPGITHWQHPNFFAYFGAASSFPALLGDMLCSGLATVGFSWIGSPAATELEKVMLDWLGKLLMLPQQFLASGKDGKQQAGGGVIQGSASESTLVALLAARARVLDGRPAKDNEKLVAYCSDQGHSSIQKACMVAGLPFLRLLDASAENDYAMDPTALEAAIEADLAAGLLPCYVCASVGTTSSCAVDPLEPIGRIARRYKLWLHVDAAYAGVTAMLPEMRAHFAGIELADSFTTNPNKCLLINLDCSCLWVADATYVRAALSLLPAYLRCRGNDLDYKDWQIPLSRRFRALKLWFVLRMYGADNLRKFLRHHLALGKLVADLVRSDKRFEIIAKPRFGLACFKPKGASNEETAALLAAVNISGKAFLVHTELSGQYVLRFAVGGAQTQERHVRATWRLIQATAGRLLAHDNVAAAQPVIPGVALKDMSPAVMRDLSIKQ